MPHLLELFSGTGSVGRAFRERGWEVTSVDTRQDFAPTICCDVGQLTREHITGTVDLIWASPPCTQYSKARTRAKRPRDLDGADALVQKVLDLAGELQCPFLFENPYTGLLKDRPVVRDLEMRVLDYCKYGAPYRKRTAIWTNTSWTPARPLCLYDCAATEPGAKRHKAKAQQGAPGPRFTLEQLYALPTELCDEMAYWADGRAWAGLRLSA